MTLPPFGDPVLRASSACAHSVYLTGWHERCPKCGQFVVEREWIEVLEAGVHVEVIDGALTVRFGPDADK